MNIYVSNLSFQIKEDELKGIFEQFGKVASAKIIVDRETQRSRGFGFVEMPQNAEGKSAIEALDGRIVDGRQLRASVAKDREERTKSSDSSSPKKTW